MRWGLGGTKAKEAPKPMQWGPRWSQIEWGPHAHVAGASVIPKRRRPPRPRGGHLGGPKAKGAPATMRRGPPWSQTGGGPLAHVAGASVVPKEKRPPRPCGRGPRWSQNTGGPRSHAAGPSVVPKGRRPPRLYVNCSGFQGWFGVLECTQRDTNR